jgi:uncharacterized membrane protein
VNVALKGVVMALKLELIYILRVIMGIIYERKPLNL